MNININSSLKKLICNARMGKLRQKEREVAARASAAEIYYVSQRTLRYTIRNPVLFLAQVVVAIVLGLVVGFVFNSLEKSIDPGIQNRLGAIFFMVVSQTLGTITSLEPLIKKRVSYIHKTISAYYRTTTFFIVKVICDVLSMRIVSSILFSLIAYCMTGLEQSAG
ncbi:unnamed protein product [Rotaria magnacalcarata]|uniref:ABC-2 type transporter transmembrane domain-containing protein n=1 Tax=Rotaria magnacalcarata TaxID=392030 RepID=A0A820Q4W8_9BILA|nr:unnamed protein product [Rotaria magnacalcarata]CAF2104105.1 unnamed protein product [Rotaria magnacalcarata]CAF4014315.1 unnamed protein product [Rotaria magnacalcarata]CAF4413633.1 unnamed protein product [Rotaria magnacalcarata]